MAPHVICCALQAPSKSQPPASTTLGPDSTVSEFLASSILLDDFRSTLDLDDPEELLKRENLEKTNMYKTMPSTMPTDKGSGQLPLPTPRPPPKSFPRLSEPFLSTRRKPMAIQNKLE
eukprot:TRINITY_DN1461_c0_g3_i1.p2 TRINITY_DN1461_c0_g3~~TRINITY_DN1461_c0_g3_i1.p2  ORF type:complete len:118 (-),score=13.96 TRINITY_DN1461_c0_g3_i1:102-455(-)